MSKKMKKVVLTLALVSSFAFLNPNTTDANGWQTDPKPALGTASTSPTFDY